ncbi:hypothetical protein [Streptomyces halstedii]|uniref:hypothetical protein n=1 Tax=Streptomyces halstedii TaxID=1944 RepID=UPI003356F278
MTSVRQRGNGRWQATVRLPDGTRRSRTETTRSRAQRWAHYTEAAAEEGRMSPAWVAALCIREDLHRDRREHEELGQELGEWVEIRRDDLETLLRAAEAGQIRANETGR